METSRLIMTPALVQLEPSQSGRIIGNLSQTQFVLQALGLATSSV
jgi:hypothetical protein